MSDIYTVTGADRNHKRRWRYMVRASCPQNACRVANTQRPAWVSGRTLTASLTDVGTEPLLGWARSMGFLVRTHN